MRFSVDKANLKLVDSILSAARTKRNESTQQSINLEASEGLLRLYTHVNGMSFCCNVPANVVEPGAISVDGAFANTIKTLVRHDDTLFWVDGYSLVINSCDSHAYVAAFEHIGTDEESSNESPEFQIELSSSDLLTAVQRAVAVITAARSAVAVKRDARVLLTNAWFCPDGDKLHVIGCDGAAMSISTIPFARSAGNPNDFIAHVDLLKSLIKIAQAFKSSNVVMSVSENTLTVRLYRGNTSVTVSMRRDFSQIPAWREMIPKAFEYEAEIDRRQLLEAINACLAQVPLYLAFHEDCVAVVLNPHDDACRLQMNVNAKVARAGISIPLHPKRLQTIVKNIDGQTVRIRANEPNAVVSISGPDDSSSLSLLMPINC